MWHHMAKNRLKKEPSLNFKQRKLFIRHLSTYPAHHYSCPVPSPAYGSNVSSFLFGTSFHCFLHLPLSQIKSNQITFIVTSPQHKCLGEWNSYERAPDSAKKKTTTTIYIWTDSAKKQQTMLLSDSMPSELSSAFCPLPLKPYQNIRE